RRTSFSRDWSPDVCASDLRPRRPRPGQHDPRPARRASHRRRPPTLPGRLPHPRSHRTPRLTSLSPHDDRGEREMSDTIAVTRTGALRGTDLDGVLAFKGVPYAAPPVGDRRFRPPAPVEPWEGTRDALTFAPSCPQPDQRPPGWPQEHALDEDRRYLNVWTPSIDDGARPVMVCIHGGGHAAGSGSWPLYDGANLARRGDVVVVTVNHRLGALGYLHLGAIAGEEFATSGNNGQLDLVASLEWVRDNIAAFGGDPGNVTVFGESGGG